MNALSLTGSVKGLLAGLVIAVLPSFAFADHGYRGGGYRGGYHSGWGYHGGYGYHDHYRSGFSLSLGFGGYYGGYYGYGYYPRAYYYDYYPGYYRPAYYYSPVVIERDYYPSYRSYYYDDYPSYSYYGRVTYHYGR